MADTTDYAASLKEIREHAQYLMGIRSPYISLCNQIENIFLLKWDEETKTKRAGGKDTKITLHPGARNNAQGAIRLMTAADPEFSVPHETNDRATQKVSSNIEKMAKAMWLASGRIRGRPVHYDVVHSAILFAEMHIPISKTADMVEYAKGASKAAQVHADEIANQTPYLFDCWDPRTGYPEMGPTGLTAYYREVEMLTGAVLDEFGDDAQRVLKSAERYKKVTVCNFWDLENRFTWIKGNDIPLKPGHSWWEVVPTDFKLTWK